MGEPRPSFLASPSRPKLKLPAGACDAHVHVFGPSKAFPFAENRPFTPSDAPKETLFALHAMLGVKHCVIVQSTCHGFDNRVVADAIAAKPWQVDCTITQCFTPSIASSANRDR